VGAFLLPLEQLSLYLNPSGLLLVVGGTLLGAIIAYPFNKLCGLWRRLYSMRAMDQEEMAQTFIKLSEIKRKDGIRALDEAGRASGNIFLAMGVNMVVDNYDRMEIRQRLEQEQDMFVTRRESEISILSLMGRLAPAFGLAGTVIGLIRMLHGLSDPNMVAAGMSVALLTTFYGIMLANLIILPLERKLRENLRNEVVEMTIIIEGLMGLSLDENRVAIAARLRSYRFASPQDPGRKEVALNDMRIGSI
jgi:chemotaxis protein MotA